MKLLSPLPDYYIVCTCTCSHWTFALQTLEGIDPTSNLCLNVSSIETWEWTYGRGCTHVIFCLSAICRLCVDPLPIIVSIDRLQGSRVCPGEAVPQLVERCQGLGCVQKQVLGHANTTMGIRRLYRGQSVHLVL